MSAKPLEKIIFWSVLILKLAAGTMFASKFLTELFIPFSNYFITSSFANPYTEFSNLGVENAFPYPAFMLYVISLPKIIFSTILPNNHILDVFYIRISLLAADITIFLILKNWLEPRLKFKVLTLYWLSPVLFYISYIHGQLDAIPIALLFVSLNYLFQNKIYQTAIWLGLALAAKTNIALVIPFFLLFLLAKSANIKTISSFLTIIVTTFYTLNIPFINNKAFIQMVLHNPEQQKLFNTAIYINDIALYLIPASLLMLIVQGILIKKYNRDVFLVMLGFCFSIILLFIAPMPGWYFWSIPFLAYFYCKEDGRAPLLFLALQCCYLGYFYLTPNAEYFEIVQLIKPHLAKQLELFYALNSFGFSNGIMLNISFTALQATLLLNCLWVYKNGLGNYGRQKLKSMPFMLGIGGNSGAGKTTIADAIASIYTELNTTIIRGDAMHKWQRHDQAWDEITHLNPKANHLHRETHSLKDLKNGKKISRRNYDHKNGTFTHTKTVKPNNLIIYEGLHPFFIKSQRHLYDLKIYIQPSLELNQYWHLMRDTNERGHSSSDVLAKIKNRQNDYNKYITSQAKQADIIIKMQPATPIADYNKKQDLAINYILTMTNSIYIEPILNQLDKVSSLNITHEYNNKDEQIITVSGNCSGTIIKTIAAILLPDFADIGVYNINWQQNSFGVLLLILSYSIFEKAKFAHHGN